MAQGRLPTDGVDGRGLKHHFRRTNLDEFHCVSSETEGVKLSEGTTLGDKRQSLFKVDPSWIDARGMSSGHDAGDYGRDAVFCFQLLLLFHQQARKSLPNIPKSY